MVSVGAEPIRALLQRRRKAHKLSHAACRGADALLWELSGPRLSLPDSGSTAGTSVHLSGQAVHSWGAALGAFAEPPDMVSSRLLS